ncbi:cell division cycle protein 20 homolog, putative [Plasmodium gallinaceum]|uniref:Cell division cycle protein 20 homolog, putative n=1 Tax=Plasmodium gallinaceum TaxID=5849 RepID=A0A1J1H1S9_PLAGA|nr:cell division cycle protein 20 homolog, putative [Plasmodium gallinaceum]CRG97278.1 cell division cycle protein 20 homolog, putative [Plasmodium gallinaceum]
MEKFFLKNCYDYNNLSEKIFKGIEKNELYLPNNNFGQFSIWNEKMRNSIFSNNLMNEYEFDIDPKELYSNYIYKTRYSRQSIYNIKIDEYTLKRKIVEINKRNINKFHIEDKKYENYDNEDTCFDKKKKVKNKNNNFIKNKIIENVNKNKYKNIFLENSFNDLIKESKNNISIDPFASYFSYPSYILNSYKKEKRKISKEPYFILSAPKLVDDFYLNLLDWSKKNIIAVGLDDKLCLWNNNACKSEELFVLNQIQKKKKNEKKKIETRKSITSLKWNIFGNYLAVGLSNGVVEIWEIERGVKIRKYKNHKLRVGALCWNYNTLTSGGRDNNIFSCDLRSKESNYVQLTKHKSEVCGLEWNYDGKQLASGSNDNSIYIWENNTNNYVFHFTKHKAAVKAISWCPHKNNLLISGGGSADKKIFFWNTTNGKCINEIDTNSQVSNILWSTNTQEFISTHSYSLNQIIIWNYPQLQKVSILTGHNLRVLYLSLSADGTSIASGSPDETIRFWNVFPKNNNFSLIPSFSDCYETIR